MTARDDIQGSLQAVVAEMRQAVDALSEALRDERDALDAGDADALDAVGERKQQRLQQLEALDAERQHLAGELGSVDPASVPGWDAVLAGLEVCRGMNEVNGRIVQRRLQHVRDAIDLVTGSDSGARLYGPGGKQVDTPLTMMRSRI